jgi:hypothetical protein
MTKKRRGVPKSTGRYFDIEDSLFEKVSEAAQSIGVSKTQIINDSIRHGFEKAVDQAKYG